MSGLLDCVQDAVDCALECKDDLGLDLCDVSILTRTWSGEEVGRGRATDEVCKISPNPSVIEFNHDLRLKEGGAIKQGDILVKSISRGSYQDELEINCRTDENNVEKFYLICDKLYNVISVRKRIATWEVQVRRLSDQERYDG